MAYEPADVYVYLIRAPKKAPSFPGHASNQFARPAGGTPCSLREVWDSLTTPSPLHSWAQSARATGNSLAEAD
jgi:hypothetical protein